MVRCVEYSSAEALYVHLEEAVLLHILALDEYDEQYKIWHLKHSQILEEWRRVKKPNAKSAVEEKIRQHESIVPRRPSGKLEMAGKRWELDHFVISIGEKRQYDPPSIKSLDEWFFANLIDPEE